MFAASFATLGAGTTDSMNGMSRLTGRIVGDADFVQYVAKSQARASQLFHLATCLFRFVQHDSLPPVSGMLAQLFETRRLLNSIHPAKSLAKKLDKAQVKFTFKEFEKLGLFYTKLSDDDVKLYSKVRGINMMRFSFS